MNKYSEKILAELSRLILLLLVMGTVYILFYVDTMRCSGELFLVAYTSVPYMIEHILAGVVVFLAFSTLIEKLKHNGRLK